VLFNVTLEPTIADEIVETPEETFNPPVIFRTSEFVSKSNPLSTTAEVTIPVVRFVDSTLKTPPVDVKAAPVFVSCEPSPTNLVAVTTPVTLTPVALIVTADPTSADVAVSPPVTFTPLELMVTADPTIADRAVTTPEALTFLTTAKSLSVN